MNIFYFTSEYYVSAGATDGYEVAVVKGISLSFGNSWLRQRHHG